MTYRKLKFGCVALLVGAVLMALPNLAMAQSHESGLMLRLTAGASYARTGQKTDLPGSPKYHIAGAALDTSVAAGFALSENFAVHATGTFWRAFKPKAKGDLGPFSSSGVLKDTNLTNFGIGGGFTAWTNGNMYISLSVLASMLRAKYNEDKIDTNWGIGGELLLGKEWWLGGNVGIGLAAAGTIHHIPDSRDKLKGNLGYSVGPRLSITFN